MQPGVDSAWIFHNLDVPRLQFRLRLVRGGKLAAVNVEVVEIRVTQCLRRWFEQKFGGSYWERERSGKIVPWTSCSGESTRYRGHESQVTPVVDGGLLWPPS